VFVPIRISTNGTVQYERGFEMLGKQAKDMTLPLSWIGRRLLTGISAQFESEGGWSGNPWTALSGPYENWKEQKVPGLPMLVGVRRTGSAGQRPQTYERSGQMKDELLSPESMIAGPQRMVYAPHSDIAGFHQDGTERMPARPPVDIPLAEYHEWDRTFVRWLNGLIVQEGLL
jgi:hypothetical protein